MRRARSFGIEVWFSTVTEQAGLTSSGEAETQEEASQAFRAAFGQWLTWVTARGCHPGLDGLFPNSANNSPTTCYEKIAGAGLD